MGKRPTRDDVARVSGTSAAVVSYVLNDGPRAVSEETRNRVLAAIIETGYRPNSIARALAHGQSNVYGLVVPDLANPFLAQLVQGLEREFFALGRSLIVGDSEDDFDREVQIVETFLREQVAGLVWYGVAQPLPLDIVESTNVPVVLLNNPPDHRPAEARDHFIYVNTDERGHAALLTRHVINHGRLRIAHLGGPSGRLNARERARGWKAALTEAGLVGAGAIKAPFTRAAGFESVAALIEFGCDAVVTSNEMQAMGLLAGLARAGVRVPDDIAVVALNGTEIGQYTVPSLTTICLSVDHLSKVIADALTPGSKLRVLETEAHLVPRASCGCQSDQQPQRETAHADDHRL